MATFVLVPGGWKGSWSYEAVAPLLERAGHTVHALTLTGLRPDDDTATAATANLDTHADDVLRHFDRAHLTDVTLVGHSYGGMVIAAAADRARGRVGRACISTRTFRTTANHAGRQRTTTSGRYSRTARRAPATPSHRPPAAIPAAAPTPSPRSRKQSGSQEHSTESRAGSSSTARDGGTRRRSPNSARGSAPIPGGRSMSSPRHDAMHEAPEAVAELLLSE